MDWLKEAPIGTKATAIGGGRKERKVMEDLQRRYQTDAHFHQLVNVFLNMFRSAQFTPSEVRDAAMFAMVQFEMHECRPTFTVKDLMEERGGQG